MPESGLLAKIDSKQIDRNTLAEEVMKKPSQLEEIFRGLNSGNANIKYGSEKVLRIISDKNPALLYPHVNFFINNLESENRFFRLGAIYTLANLASVDSENKIDGLFDRYFSPISGPMLTAAANTIVGGAKIALAKPLLMERVVQEILKVENARYKTDDCQNIAIGKAIESFDQFFTGITNKKSVIMFIRKQLGNPRSATQKKAERFIKKHQDYFEKIAS